MVITTRDADVARRVCDEVALLDRGTVVESGTLLGLLGKPGSQLAEAVLPPLTTPRAHLATYDRAVDVVLVGFAAVGALLPEASARFDVDFTTIGGGLTRPGDTPVARSGSAWKVSAPTPRSPGSPNGVQPAPPCTACATSPPEPSPSRRPQ